MKFKPGIYETDIEGGGYAINPRVDGKIISWDDLTHRRQFEIAEVADWSQSDGDFIFTDSESRAHFIRPLTLEGYLKNIQPVMGGKRFKRLDQLLDAIRSVLELGH